VYILTIAAVRRNSVVEEVLSAFARGRERSEVARIDTVRKWQRS
jgi:hypothetical protein